MADVTVKSVRLLDNDVRLYPRVMLKDIVKSVAADGTETSASLVESVNSSGRVYVTISVNGEVTNSSHPYSLNRDENTIAMRGMGGSLQVGPIYDNYCALNVSSANVLYGRLSAKNAWTDQNTFDSANLAIRAKLEPMENPVVSFTNTGFIYRANQSASERSIIFQDNDGTIAYLGNVNTAQEAAIAAAKSYTDTQISSKLSAALVYKGTKATYADLPKTGNKVGDTWNVEAAYGNAHAGTNWAWNGTTWDPLGGSIDLTNYVTAATAFNGSQQIVLTTGAGRGITGSLYVIGSMTESSHTATLIPNANSIYTWVNSKISGSIVDSSRVVYSNVSTAWTGEKLTVSIAEPDGTHIINAKYGVNIVVNGNSTDDGIPTSHAVYAYVSELSLQLNQLISQKLDKHTATGKFIYGHDGANQQTLSYGSTTATAGAIVQRGVGGAVLLPDYGTATPGGNDAISKTYLDRILDTQVLNKLISYEEVA